MEKTVIFDFDGVLANSMDQILSIAEEACRRLGFPVTVSSEDIMSLETMEYFALAEHLGIPKGMRASFVDIVDDIYEERDGSAGIVEGIKDVIIVIKNQYLLAIVTGNTVSVVKAFLEDNKMGGWFDKILGKESAHDKADKISQVITELNLSKKSVVMIGDAASDIRASRKAGVGCISVTWGNQSRELLLDESPGIICDTPSELLEVLLDLDLKNPVQAEK